MSEEKNDYAFYSEALHSSYLFYTMEVDKLNKQLQTAKEENDNLTQQNKQMMEAIEMGMDVLQNNNKNTVQSEEFRDKLDGLWVIFNQALKGVE